MKYTCGEEGDVSTDEYECGEFTECTHSNISKRLIE